MGSSYLGLFGFSACFFCGLLQNKGIKSNSSNTIEDVRGMKEMNWTTEMIQLTIKIDRLINSEQHRHEGACDCHGVARCNNAGTLT